MAHTVDVETPLDMAPRHIRRLAALAGATPSAIVEAISLWPLGVRLALSAHNIIDYNAGDAANHSISADDVEAAASRGEPLEFAITPIGQRVIAECAQWVERHDDDGVPASDTWPETVATSEELEEIRPGDGTDGKSL